MVTLNVPGFQISFGSLFWSAQPEKIWTFLDVVIEKKIPFVSPHSQREYPQTLWRNFADHEPCIPFCSRPR